MPCSASNRRTIRKAGLRTTVTSLLLVLGLSGIAMAQTPAAGPIQAAPVQPVQPASNLYGHSATPDPQENTPVNREPLTDNTPTTTKAETDSAMAGIGLLDPGRHGGLPLDLWRGTDARLADTLIKGIPGNTHVAILRQLARRVLLSTGLPPADIDVGFPFDRTEALLRLGYFADAARMASTVRQLDLPRADRLLATASLFSGDIPAACGALRETDRGQGDTDGFWDRLDLLCQVTEGNRGAVGFLVPLLREAGHSTDSFLSVATAMVDGPVPDALLAGIDRTALDPLSAPVTFVAYLRAGMTLADDAPLLWQRIRLSQLPDGFHRDTAALASLVALARAGWLDHNGLQQQIDRAGFVAEDVKDPLDGTALTGSGQALLLLTAAAGEPQPVTRAALLAAALRRLAPFEGSLRPLVDAQLTEITPGSDTAMLAATAFLLLTTDGMTGQAAPWLRPASGAPATMIAQFIARLDQDNPTPPALGDNPALAPLQPMARAVLAGLGRIPAGNMLAEALSGPEQLASHGDAGHPALMMMLANQAAAATGQAQPLLTALLLAGDRPLASLSPIEVMLLTGALKHAGFTQEALQLAQQAILSAASDNRLDGIPADDNP